MIRYFLPAILLMATLVRGATAERGQLDASPTLFTVMAALNAAGYDADLNSPNNHPLRMAIRKAVADKHLPCIAELKKFFEAHHQKNDTQELSQYISYALAVDGTPDFSFKGRTVEVPPDIEVLEGLGPLLVSFAKEANIEELWQKSQPAFEQAIGRYHQLVARAILLVNAYLRNPTSGVHGRRFQIYLDLLAAPNQIQSRSYGNNYYVVITPSLEPQIHDVRHAYLFYLLDLLATRQAEVLDRKRGLIDHAQRAPALPEHYKVDFLLLTTASLVKAVEARLDKKAELVNEALGEGFILAPFFAEQLLAYEKQEQSMQFYYPEMVKAMDLRVEDARLSKAQFAPAARVRQAKTAPAPPPPVITGAAKTLEDAEQLYLARELDKAKDAFLKALRETGEKPLHAQAYYGLARIAVLQKDPELAERLFQKTLDSMPEPQIKAWAYVYLGRLSQAAGESAAAATSFNNALGVEGASDAARRAATQGIEHSSKKQD